jgi:hypothetical protein
MHNDRKIQYWATEYVRTHILVAHLLFWCFDIRHCPQVVKVAFRTEVAPDMVEAHPFLHSSSVSVDSVLCHFGNESSCPSDFHKPLPGVFLSQSSNFYTQETQHLSSSLFRLRHSILISCCVFSIVACKTRCWPFWPYSTQHACLTVLAICNLHAWPS